MNATSVRLVPFATADGPHNMAADETLLHAAIAGQASLRFYAWSPATLSLGYFQPAATRLSDPRLARLPWVRRPTGGATLVHDREVTYALALPAGVVGSAAAWMGRMHRVVARALESLGVSLTSAETNTHDSDVLCFRQQTPGDLVSGQHKVLGSAQRKQRQALLQHGSLLLAQSEHTPTLPGIKELTGADLVREDVIDAIRLAFAKETGWTFIEQDWGAEEVESIKRLASSKYGADSWNHRR